MNCPQLTEKASATGDDMANSYNKVLQRTSRPYRGLRTKLHIFRVKENGIPSTNFIDCYLQSHTSIQVINSWEKAKQTVQLAHKNRKQQNAVEDARKATKKDSAVPEE